jgi:bifunctional DNA-binding transcriptional regulator/antitoxin component of YhaV-PrlF toxin-antitoxin module
MAVEKHIDEDIDFDAGGFAEIDAEGRLTLPASLRDTFGLHTGSVVACFSTSGGIMLLPSDRDLVGFMEQGSRMLEDAGITTQDFLDNLPKVREEVMIETYGEEFVRELDRRYGHLIGTEIRSSDGE